MNQFIFSFLCVLFSSVTFAEDAKLPAVLIFDPPIIAVSPSMDDTSGTYIVKVTNQSKLRQIISEFKGGCGCITHTLGQKTLESGESTNLTVKFEFNDTVGDQNRRVTLMTLAEGDEKTIRNELRMVGKIPSPLTFSTQAVVWFYQAPPIPKTISIAVDPTVILTDLQVEQPNASQFMKVESNLSANAKSLTVQITPVTTDMATISPVEKTDLRQAYVVSYRLPSGVRRFEKIFVLVAKKP